MQWIERGGLMAAVSRVPAGEFGEEALHESLNDLAWLERVARAHETVLERAGEERTIVPLRLCTIFAAVANVERMLEADRPTLTAALERLQGRQEWAVKLLVDPEMLEAACSADDADDDHELGRGLPARAQGGAGASRGRGPAGSGTRGERPCPASGLGRRRGRESAAESRAVRARRRDAAQRRIPRGDAPEPDELRALATELQERHEDVGARIEVTGPLPPFNFVSRPDPDSAA